VYLKRCVFFDHPLFSTVVHPRLFFFSFSLPFSLPLFRHSPPCAFLSLGQLTHRDFVFDLCLLVFCSNVSCPPSLVSVSLFFLPFFCAPQLHTVSYDSRFSSFSSVSSFPPTEVYHFSWFPPSPPLCVSYPPLHGTWLILFFFLTFSPLSLPLSLPETSVFFLFQIFSFCFSPPISDILFLLNGCLDFSFVFFFFSPPNV